jgi:hypothetical protein
MDWSPHDSGEVMFTYPKCNPPHQILQDRCNGGVKQAMMDAPNHGSMQDNHLLKLQLLLANAPSWSY